MNPLAIFYVSLAVMLLLSGCAQAGGSQAGAPLPHPTSAQSPQPASPSPVSMPQPASSPTEAKQVTPSPTPASRPTAPSPTGQPSGKGTTVPAAAVPLVEKARQDAARRAGVAPEQVTVVSVRAVEWRDSSLGCPQPGMMYLQVITPGYRIFLSAGGKTYEYHTDRRQQVVTCDNPEPPTSS